jgi:hypothetical protein
VLRLTINNAKLAKFYAIRIVYEYFMPLHFMIVFIDPFLHSLFGAKCFDLQHGLILLCREIVFLRLSHVILVKFAKMSSFLLFIVISAI